MVALIPKMTRSEFEKLLAEGWTFRGAALYEPDHAPSGTRFAHVQLSAAITKFVRLSPPALESAS